MYKVVEECIKALAQAYNIEEYVKASEEGRWWVSLIGKAARRLAGILNEPRVEFAWSVAYDLHVWGLHEAKYTINDVRGDLNHGSGYWNSREVLFYVKISSLPKYNIPPSIISLLILIVIYFRLLSLG
jgi:PaREP1/PaREP8 domain containing family protein